VFCLDRRFVIRGFFSLYLHGELAPPINRRLISRVVTKLSSRVIWRRRHVLPPVISSWLALQTTVHSPPRRPHTIKSPPIVTTPAVHAYSPLIQKSCSIIVITRLAFYMRVFLPVPLRRAGVVDHLTSYRVAIRRHRRRDGTHVPLPVIMSRSSWYHRPPIHSSPDDGACSRTHPPRR